MKKVLIIYRFLPQYRVDFFQQLRNVLLQYDIQLELIYGKLKNSDALKKDEMEIDWAKFIPANTFRIGKTELIWQSCLKKLKNADLVIVQPENKLLLNYLLMILRHFSNYKLCFWGHGRNMQSGPGSLRNRFKYLFIKNCDWWFVYTKGIKQFIMGKKYPENKITVVQNAIDTITLAKYYEEIEETELSKLKDELGITGDKTGIYCGGMYGEKRIDFILEACHRIKREIPDFHMIFIGSGIDAVKPIHASFEHDWIHYAGPKFGKDRVQYFRMSSIQLMPSAVGLGVLDSFAMQTPIVTTVNPRHGPEFEYLENGVNGIITRDNIQDYSKMVVDILKTQRHVDLINGCKLSAKMYTVEKMVENFKNGILSSLQYRTASVARAV